ncbi:MAG: amidase [Leucobacter sp.]|nr:amidase [Leucobacter sp.]
MSACELAAAYRAGTLSPVDAVEAVLERLERLNPALNAFVTVTADAARAEAQEAARRFAQGGDDLPPLLGVPITVKDLVETAGVRTTYGAVAYADNVPASDAIAWGRLKAAGAILIGKTTTPEFGLLGTTESHLTGVTNNPWDLGRTSGGSSGGAAASLAVGIAPIAWGSDGGGSIRVPAALCGVVGFKPSVGRIPHLDNVDASDTQGPMARRVVDIALMLNATVGPDLRDRFALPATGEDYVAAVLDPRPLTGVRIAASVDLGEDDVEPAVAERFHATVEQLRAAGAVVEDVDFALPNPEEYFLSYVGSEYQLYADMMAMEGQPVWPFIQDLADRARNLTPSDVSMAFRQIRTQIYNAFVKALGPNEFLVTPTTPLIALTHEVVAATKTTTDPVAHLHRLTEAPSHAGLPALTLPIGLTDEGLPVGIQLIGRPHADAEVVSLGRSIEELISPEFIWPLSDD